MKKRTTTRITRNTRTTRTTTRTTSKIITKLMVCVIVLSQLTGCGIIQDRIEAKQAYEQGMKDHRDRMEAYIEDKFDLDFEVVLPIKVGMIYGMGGEIKTEATTVVDGVEIECTIRYDLHRSIEEDGYFYTDDFKRALWISQSEPLLQSLVDDIYGSDAYYTESTLTVTSNSTATEEEKLHANFEDLRVLEQADKIEYIIKQTIYIFTTEDFDREAEAERYIAYRNHVSQEFKHLLRNDVKVYFLNENYEDWDELVNRKENGDLDTRDELVKEGLLLSKLLYDLDWLGDEELSLEDIMNSYFEYENIKEEK